MSGDHLVVSWSVWGDLGGGGGHCLFEGRYPKQTPGSVLPQSSLTVLAGLQSPVFEASKDNLLLLLLLPGYCWTNHCPHREDPLLQHPFQWYMYFQGSVTAPLFLPLTALTAAAPEVRFVVGTQNQGECPPPPPPPNVPPPPPPPRVGLVVSWSVWGG